MCVMLPSLFMQSLFSLPSKTLSLDFLDVTKNEASLVMFGRVVEQLVC